MKDKPPKFNMYLSEKKVPILRPGNGCFPGQYSQVTVAETRINS